MLQPPGLAKRNAEKQGPNPNPSKTKCLKTRTDTNLVRNGEQGAGFPETEGLFWQVLFLARHFEFRGKVGGEKVLFGEPPRGSWWSGRWCWCNSVMVSMSVRYFSSSRRARMRPDVKQSCPAQGLTTDWTVIPQRLSDCRLAKPPASRRHSRHHHGGRCCRPWIVHFAKPIALVAKP